MWGRMWVNEWASEGQGVHRGASLLKKGRSNSEHSLIRSTFHIDLCINKYIYFLLIISQIVTTYKNSFLFLYFCCCLERSKKAEKKYVWPFLSLAFPSLQLVFVLAFTSLWLTSDFFFTSPYFWLSFLFSWISSSFFHFGDFLLILQSSWFLAKFSHLPDFWLNFLFGPFFTSWIAIRFNNKRDNVF